MSAFIPYSTQNIDASDCDAVLETLMSPYLTCGPKAGEFEDAVCAFTGAGHAVACNSCTSALHLAMMALGVGPGDTVYVSAISFAASANCARMCGADVEFVDVDPQSGLMDMDCLEQMLDSASGEGRLPKAVIAVDLSGRCVDLKRLRELSMRYGFKVVEDAAHALGATFNGKIAGCGDYSDITVLSFHPVKIITTAEGGMALTGDPELARKMRCLCSHGIVHEKERLRDQGRPAYYYEMQDLGWNYRMCDLLASLGISQMRRVGVFLEMRRRKARMYQDLLGGAEGISLPQPDTEGNESSWHLYQVRIGGGRRDQVYEQLRSKNIGVQVHYLPIYRHPYYWDTGRYVPLQGAEEFFSSTLSIPLYPTLSHLQQQLCAAALMSAAEGR
ncbi:MAG: UDP-4-amino-4,6-dideoxy-N-acetyl-beta-L-altrosamine transaminase [Succinivibrio sp.]